MSYGSYIYSSGKFLYNGMISFYLPLCLPRYSSSSLPERRKKGREWELDLGRMSTGCWACLEKPDILLRFPGLPEPTGSKIHPTWTVYSSFIILKADHWPILPNKNERHVGGVGKEYFRPLKLLF